MKPVTNYKLPRLVIAAKNRTILLRQSLHPTAINYTLWRRRPVYRSRFVLVSTKTKHALCSVSMASHSQVERWLVGWFSASRYHKSPNVRHVLCQVTRCSPVTLGEIIVRHWLLGCYTLDNPAAIRRPTDLLGQNRCEVVQCVTGLGEYGRESEGESGEVRYKGKGECAHDCRRGMTWTHRELYPLSVK